MDVLNLVCGPYALIFGTHSTKARSHDMAESSCPCCQQQLPFELLPDKRRLGAVCAHTNLAAEAAAAAGTAEAASLSGIYKQ